KQVESVISYAETFRCRSQQLLVYFNEKHAGECGTCDVCMENRRQANKEKLADEIVKEILDALSDHQLVLDKLMISIQSGSDKEKLDTIRMLLDAGTIKANGEFY